jgi:NADH-quinone oxidoreductase subunit L
MTMDFLLIATVLSPLLACIWIFATPNDEHRVAAIALLSTRLMGAATLALLALWVFSGFPAHEYQWFMLYENQDYQFPVLFFLDRVAACYLFVVWAVFAVIVKYCRVYLHRETGFKRFFQTIFLFKFGLNIIVLSGSIDMLFVGWEIVGIASFLLIAFYRHRPQPVRNALRAYTIYRLCDVGLLMGAWLTHLLLHDGQHFSELLIMFDKQGPTPAGYASLSMLSWLIILAASGKSAQFPFCFWLPRAMEGPTPSSAIFYGALSIHLGVFLLLRTFPVWSYNLLPRLMIFSIGALTLLVAGLSEKTQSNIKGQVAYASIAQVGLMFIELSLGLQTLVLIHFMGNAFLRCYQLLVSPSVVAHMLRVEGTVTQSVYPAAIDRFGFLPHSVRSVLPEVLSNTIYVFALQEGQLELLVRGICWQPLKRAGDWINRRRPQMLLYLAAVAGLILLTALFDFGQITRALLAVPVAVAMGVVSLSAFSNKHLPLQIWHHVALSSVLAAIAVWMMVPQAVPDVWFFLSGIIPSWLLGVYVLRLILADEANFAEDPFVFRAIAERNPKRAFLLFLSLLGIVGFPITPAFLGEDLLIAHASNEYPWFALPITLCFVINGIAAARVYLRLCMGRPADLHESSVMYGERRS